MLAHCLASLDFVQDFPPPGQPDLADQRIGRHLGCPGQFVIEGVEGDDIGPDCLIGDETAGHPAVGVHPPDQAIKVIGIGFLRHVQMKRPAGKGGPSLNPWT